MKLVVPSPEYLQSYYEACVETWPSLDPFNRHLLHDPEKFAEWRETIFTDYADAKAGRNLPEGWFPYETLWMVDESGYVGTLVIRFLKDGIVFLGGELGLLVRSGRRKSNAVRDLLVLGFERLRDTYGRKLFVMACRDCDEKNVAFERRIRPVEREVLDELDDGGRKVVMRQFWRDLDKLELLKRYGSRGKRS